MRAVVTNWGTGTPRREFLHVDDMAEACLHLLEHYDGPEQVNVGTGTDVTIREIAETIANVVGYAGETEWDTTKPDGTPQKLLDVSKLAEAGWTAKIGLEEGSSAPSPGIATTSASCAARVTSATGLPSPCRGSCLPCRTTRFVGASAGRGAGRRPRGARRAPVRRRRAARPERASGRPRHGDPALRTLFRGPRRPADQGRLQDGRPDRRRLAVQRDW